MVRKLVFLTFCSLAPTLDLSEDMKYSYFKENLARGKKGGNCAIGALSMWQKIANGYMSCENEKLLGSKYI